MEEGVCISGFLALREGPLVQVVGNGVTPIVDTWWQTETGSHLITPLPYATDLKPGSATLPFFGVEPAILNDKVDLKLYDTKTPTS